MPSSKVSVQAYKGEDRRGWLSQVSFHRLPKHCWDMACCEVTVPVIIEADGKGSTV